MTLLPLPNASRWKLHKFEWNTLIRASPGIQRNIAKHHGITRERTPRSFSKSTLNYPKITEITGKNFCVRFYELYVIFLWLYCVNKLTTSTLALFHITFSHKRNISRTNVWEIIATSFLVHFVPEIFTEIMQNFGCLQDQKKVFCQQN